MAWLMGTYNMSFSWLAFLISFVYFAQTKASKQSFNFSFAEVEKELRHSINIGEAETSDWLSYGLEGFWQAYEPNLAETIMNAVNGLLGSKNIPLINSIKIQTLTLGTDPPSVRSVKVMGNPRKDAKDEVDLELDCSFMAPTAKAVVILRLGKSFMGAALPIQVQEVSIEARVRLRGLLIAKKPYLKHLSVSFMEKPKLDFAIKPLKSLDVMELPMVSKLLDNIIHDNIEKFLVHPERILVNVEKLVNGVTDDFSNYSQCCGVVHVRVLGLHNMKSLFIEKPKTKPEQNQDRDSGIDDSESASGDDAFNSYKMIAVGEQKIEDKDSSGVFVSCRYSNRREQATHLTVKRDKIQIDHSFTFVVDDEDDIVHIRLNDRRTAGLQLMGKELKLPVEQLKIKENTNEMEGKDMMFDMYLPISSKKDLQHVKDKHDAANHCYLHVQAYYFPTPVYNTEDFETGEDIMIEANGDKQKPTAKRRIREKVMKNTLGCEAVRAAGILLKFLKPPIGEPKIPKGIIEKARGLVILKTVTAGCMTSVCSGSGIIIGRLASGCWSAPSGIRLAGMGGGVMIGVEFSEIVIVINTKEAFEEFFEAKVKLGGNFKVAAGPSIGKSGNDKVFAPVYTYVGKKGVFAGFSLEGQVLLERKECNRDFFGRPVSAAELLTSKIANISEIESLYAVLDEQLGDNGDGQYNNHYDMAGYKSIEIGETCRRGFGIFTLYVDELRLDNIPSDEIHDVYVVVEHGGRSVIEARINLITWAPQNGAFVEWVLRSFSKAKATFMVIDFDPRTNAKTLLGYAKLDLSSQLPPGQRSGSGIKDNPVQLKGWVTNTFDRELFSKMHLVYHTSKKAGATVKFGRKGSLSPRKSISPNYKAEQASQIVGMIKTHMTFRPVDHLTSMNDTSTNPDIADIDDLDDDMLPYVRQEERIFKLNEEVRKSTFDLNNSKMPGLECESEGTKGQTMQKKMHFENYRANVSIFIQEARDLFANDWGGTSDPYVRVIFNGEKIYKTKTIKKTINPVWGEKLLIPMVNRAADSALFIVKDWNLATKAVSIGMCEVQFKDYLMTAEEGDAIDIWVPLKPEGELKLTMYWGKVNFGGRKSIMPGTLISSVTQLSNRKPTEETESSLTGGLLGSTLSKAETLLSMAGSSLNVLNWNTREQSVEEAIDSTEDQVPDETQNDTNNEEFRQPSEASELYFTDESEEPEEKSQLMESFRDQQKLLFF
eukprot:Nk52_evm5s270 gene=Nk52_evmTU5s270